PARDRRSAGPGPDRVRQQPDGQRLASNEGPPRPEPRRSLHGGRRAFHDRHRALRGHRVARDHADGAPGSAHRVWPSLSGLERAGGGAAGRVPADDGDLPSPRTPDGAGRGAALRQRRDDGAPGPGQRSSVAGRHHPRRAEGPRMDTPPLSRSVRAVRKCLSDAVGQAGVRRRSDGRGRTRSRRRLHPLPRDVSARHGAGPRLPAPPDRRRQPLLPELALRQRAAPAAAGRRRDADDPSRRCRPERHLPRGRGARHQRTRVVPRHGRGERSRASRCRGHHEGTMAGLREGRRDRQRDRGRARLRHGRWRRLPRQPGARGQDIESRMLFRATVLTISALLALAAPAVAFDDLRAPGAQVEKMADGFSFTEGPTADAAGNVFFTDQPNDRILEWSVDGKLTTFLQPAGRSNGMYFDRDGSLIACADEKNELWSIAKDGKSRVIWKEHEHKKLNGPNDVWVHPSGSLYFTDPFYKRPWWTHDAPPQGGQHVYRLSADRKKITRVTTDLEQPNGIIGSPDGKTL